MTGTALALPPGPVLVTGGSGFIGCWAIEALKHRGADLHLVGRRDPGLGLPFHAADLLDAGQRRTLFERLRPTALLHNAWFTKHREFWSARENLDWAQASIDLAQIFAACGGQRLVFVGSCAEYDWSLPETASWTEDRPVRPATLYGQTKARVAAGIQDLATKNGFSFAWARVFGAVGFGEKSARLVPSLILALLAGERATTGPGEVARDFLDVRDAGRALAALFASQVTGPINLGSGIGVEIGEIATKLGQMTGRPELIGIGERPARDGEPRSIVAEIGRLRDEVGFTPAIAFDRMLEDAISYWREP